MRSKLVDVILPNYNKGKYLEEAINSVLNQTYKSWKLYIIDDHSNDNSNEVLEKFKKFDNIFILKLEKNKGPSFCRNLGIRVSSSKFIAFLDSDDYWHKDKLYQQIEFMEKGNYKFSFTDYSSFYQIENKKKFIKETNLPNEFDLNQFSLNSSINTSTMIISRLILKNIKFKKVKKLEDYLFKCEILKMNIKAFKINSNLAFYRILKSSRSSEKLKNVFYLWMINKKFLRYSFFKNIFSILSISLNSVKKYGLK